MEGAPGQPNTNQTLNAAKFQLGELYTLDQLNRALQNVRQLMQENGYYRARVTAESTSNPATQQVSILFHITPGEPAHVGEVKATGHSAFSQGQLQDIARMHPGERVTAARVTNSLQRLRKKFQKQQRVLAQVSIAEQKYRARIQRGRLYLPDRTRTGRCRLHSGFSHPPRPPEKRGPGLRGKRSRRRPAERGQTQPSRLPPEPRPLRRHRRGPEGDRP